MQLPTGNGDPTAGTRKVSDDTAASLRRLSKRQVRRQEFLFLTVLQFTNLDV